MPLPDRTFGRDQYRLDLSRQVLLLDRREKVGSGSAGEIYLRLADLDLDDPMAILAFVNTYDKMNVFEASFPDGSFGIPLSFREERTLAEGRKVLGEAVVREQPGVFPDASKAADGDDQSEPVVAFRLAAQTLRDGLRAWRLLRGDVDYDDIEWESDEFGLVDLAPSASARDRRARYQLHAVDSLVHLFDYALRPFHPGISIDHAKFGTRGAADVTLVPSHERQGLDLYPICALELYRHVAENAHYSVCENETCDRLFVRQMGRAKYGQYRTRGVLYCRPSCARAQAQREYRRRNRQ